MNDINVGGFFKFRELNQKGWNICAIERETEFDRKTIQNLEIKTVKFILAVTKVS